MIPDLSNAISAPIGLVGLGRMGLPIAKRLVHKGFDVIAFDICKQRCQLASDAGITVGRSLSELIRHSKVILVCVLGGDAVCDVVNSIEKDRMGKNSGGTFVDLSTTPVNLTKHLAERLLHGHSMGWVDAPVSGGPAKAARGTLALMAGGRTVDVAAVKPILDSLTKHLVHMGPIGAGQAAKMVNQLLALSNYCLLAEALELARIANVDLSLLPKALKGGHADSSLLQEVFPGMASHNYGSASRIGQMAEDLNTVINFAEQFGIGLPVTTRVNQLYEQAVLEGYQDLAGPALAAYYDEFWDGSS
jgi:3-hydroxyisobutyrate dehydrogenase